LDDFLGSPSFAETYLERFRTFMLANAAFYALSFVGDKYFPVFPYNDRALIFAISKYHPRARELRRLEFLLLRQYKNAYDLAVDTTHLKVNAPYSLHKFTRVLRFILNIGFHRKVPFIQNGDPPKFRAFKYFDHSQENYREYVRGTIQRCPFYNEKAIRQYLTETDMINRTNFYTYHREAVNISVLFRLAVAAKALQK